MKAEYGDKTVCGFCNGTGVERIKMGRFVYARNCTHGKQETFGAQPMLGPDEKPEPQLKPKGRGNRWHTKN